MRVLGFSIHRLLEFLVTSLRLDTHIPLCSLLGIILKQYFSLTMRNQYSRLYKTADKFTLSYKLKHTVLYSVREGGRIAASFPEINSLFTRTSS
jgi:hypothetical protein